MLFGLKEPLKTGAKVPLTLTFEKAGKVDVEAEVVAIGAAPPGAANASPGADKGSASGEHKMDHGSGSGSGSGNWSAAILHCEKITAEVRFFLRC